MIRVILDTNVLISAIYFGGTPLKVLEGVETGSFVLVLTPNIFSEYEVVTSTIK